VGASQSDVPSEQVYMSFREVIDELKASNEWMEDLESDSGEQ